MAEQKKCKQCGQGFEVTDEDLGFYKKMSPTFDGKTFEIPSPTLCPDCRQQRRFTFLNEFNIYKNKSTLSGEQLLSVYSPDKEQPVYSYEEWWSDKWNPLSYGCEYDSTVSFFDQFGKLRETVPRVNLGVDNRCEGCEYSNQISTSKNCYLAFAAVNAEDCLYTFRIIDSKDCVDCFYVVNCENCYQGVDINKCYGCQYIQDSLECSNSYFISDCVGCSNCIMCCGLYNKDLYYKNEKIEKSEFEKLKKEIEESGPKEIETKKEELAQLKKSLPTRFAKLISVENVTGHNIANGKSSKAVFDGSNIEDCSYCQYINDSKDCFDVNFGAANTTLHLESMMSGVNVNNILFSSDTWPAVSNLIYCDSCSNGTKDCFGCIGLRGKQYCILNKQYSKEEYEKKVAQIIERMIESNEWGEYFPMRVSSFAYNETVAMDYFPIKKEDAERLGAKWLSEDYTPHYEGEIYKPQEKIQKYTDDAEEREKLLSGIIKCEVTNKPFKVMPAELAFYMTNKIPVPIKHYDARYRERLNLRNPRKLWHRKCMCEESEHGHEGVCQVEFETTYSPDRSEKIHCDDCYQKIIL